MEQEFMKKRKTKYQKRWLVLRGYGVLDCYKKSNDSARTGQIELCTITDMKITDSKTTFEATARDKVWKFRTKTEQGCTEWFDAINNLRLRDAQPIFKLFVGIDFGTYGSSLAYVESNGKAQSHVWSNDKRTGKPRTAILLDKHLEVEESGANARNFYLMSDSEKIEKRGWKLFERFKMNLYEDREEGQHEKEVNLRRARIRSMGSADDEWEAAEVTEKVFVGQLAYLKKETFKFIAKNYAKKLGLNGDGKNGWDEVQYFLTVPGI